MTRPHGHPLTSVAATLALSDWERRTALAGPVEVDETEDDDPGADLPEPEFDEDEIAEGRLRAMDYDAWADL